MSAAFPELTDDAYSLLDQLARALRLTSHGLQPTLDAVVATAARTIQSARYAGLILIEDNVLTPQATLGEPPHDLDLLQRELGEGPCLDAARAQRLVRVEDTATDPRWPAVLRRAAELGVGSMLCVPLWVDDQVLGALSLYGDRSDAFSEPDEQLTQLYATLAAIALADSQRAVQLQAGLANRDVIGQAKGILMERHQLTAESAFAVLATASQRANVKLAVVAQHLAETGELIGSTAQ